MRVTVIRLAVCLCGMAAYAFANGPAAADDQKTTRAEDLARQFHAVWDSVDLTISHPNPARVGDHAAHDTQTLSISGEIEISDPAHLVGFDRQNVAAVTHLVDEQGRNVTASLRPNDNGGQRWYGPLSYQQTFDTKSNQWHEILQPQRFWVAMNVVAGLPRRLSRVEGTVRVLTYRHEEQVDVPFVSNGKPVEVLPGVRVSFASAVHDKRGYSYQLASDPKGDQPPFTGLLHPDEALPDQMVVGQYLIDSSGKPIGSGQTHAFGNFPALGGTGAGGGTGSDRIAAMRFIIAVGLREERVPLTLKDIDLPQVKATQQ